MFCPCGEIGGWETREAHLRVISFNGLLDLAEPSSPDSDHAVCLNRRGSFEVEIQSRFFWLLAVHFVL
jgi:hypothetical protein